MWDPLLKRQLTDCIPMHSQLVQGAPEVYGILHASAGLVEPHKRDDADEAVASVYRQLPRVAVAVQAGSLGDSTRAVMKAIESEREPPIRISLERDLDLAGFDRLHARAVQAMRACGDFFGVMLDACRDAAARRTGDFARLWCLVEEQKRTQADVYDHLAALVELSRSAGYPLSLDTSLLTRLLALSSRLDQATLQLERERLEQDVLTRANARALSRRSVVELYVHQLESKEAPGNGAELTIAACRQALAEDDVQPDGSMLQNVCDVIGGEYLTHGIGVRAGEQHRPNMGGGEVVSRLMELAPLLDIDLRRYPSVPLYVHYSHLLHKLETSGTTGFGGRITGAIERLEDDLRDALPDGEEDDALAELLAPVTLMHTLRRGLIVFNARDVDALIDFSAARMLQALAELGGGVPPGWAARAAHTDEQMGFVAEFSLVAERRGRRMADELHGELVGRGIASAVLLCDGYLGSAIVDGFARRVAYTMLVPTG